MSKMIPNFILFKEVKSMDNQTEEAYMAVLMNLTHVDSGKKPPRHFRILDVTSAVADVMRDVLLVAGEIYLTVICIALTLFVICGLHVLFIK